MTVRRLVGLLGLQGMCCLEFGGRTPRIGHGEGKCRQLEDAGRFMQTWESCLGRR